MWYWRLDAGEIWAEVIRAWGLVDQYGEVGLVRVEFEGPGEHAAGHLEIAFLVEVEHAQFAEDVTVHGGISYFLHKNKILRPRIYADTPGFAFDCHLIRVISAVKSALELAFLPRNLHGAGENEKCMRERLSEDFGVFGGALGEHMQSREGVVYSAEVLQAIDDHPIRLEVHGPLFQQPLEQVQGLDILFRLHAELAEVAQAQLVVGVQLQRFGVLPGRHGLSRSTRRASLC